MNRCSGVGLAETDVIVAKNLELFAGSRVAPEWESPVMLSNLSYDPSTAKPVSFGVVREYRLSVLFGISFRANEQQLEGAYKRSTALFVSRLFGEAQAVLGELEASVYDYDQPKALALCRSLRRLLSAKEV